MDVQQLQTGLLRRKRFFKRIKNSSKKIRDARNFFSSNKKGKKMKLSEESMIVPNDFNLIEINYPSNDGENIEDNGIIEINKKRNEQNTIISFEDEDCFLNISQCQSNQNVRHSPIILFDPK